MHKEGPHDYDALDLPDEALTHGGVEILRAGVIDDELYVSARRAFVDPGQWGEVLAEVTRRLALLYSLESDFTEAQVIGAIESAFAADLGAPAVAAPRKAPAKKKAKAKKSKTKSKSSRAKPAPKARKAAKKKR